MLHPRAYYFGVYGKSGHYFYNENSPRDRPMDFSKLKNFPWTEVDLDAGLLEYWNASKRSNGLVYWTNTEIPTWYAFCWWDTSGNKEFGSNSGFYVSGFNPGEEFQAFNYAKNKFHSIITRYRHPLRLRTTKCDSGVVV